MGASTDYADVPFDQVAERSQKLNYGYRTPHAPREGMHHAERDEYIVPSRQECPTSRCLDSLTGRLKEIRADMMAAVARLPC
jgi:hypothetical protein